MKTKDTFHKSGPAYIISQYFPESMRPKIKIQVNNDVAN